MIIIPAIDLKDGQCVRLFQGKRDAVTKYSNDPADTAKQWESCGAELLHIVDLDGAFTGRPKNLEAIIKIRNAVNIPIQLGGGVRSFDIINKIFSAGIDRVIIGTAAIQDPKFLNRSCSKYHNRILVGIDAKDGMLAIKGWKEITTVKAVELAKSLEIEGIGGIVYTDITRDGTLSGPNITAIKNIVENVKTPVIAAGGVCNIEDIKKLVEIKGLWGVITGKAIYEGTLDLKEAIKFVKSNA
ncbi:MAG: 1-(5-phosphoribosyl)-5-[(5-phosphoribosylamino)methylideneamino]imidazole-4-carboxamide isomerase [Nitrospirae bacterium]|nr:1-(5-phosphoribosyl)-5-[(5-phosphoribosylamino)methylideneamino]imidazole-4-carboxamide isomerase [Nitrospirota bacterium]